MQGLIASGYAHLPCSTFLLLGIGDGLAAQKWLGPLIEEITTASGRSNNCSLNIAFTAHGLSALGLAESVLNGFSFPFREGMVHAHRSRILGDTGRNAPNHWSWGAPGQEEIHILLLVYAPSATRLEDEVARISSCFPGAGIKEILKLEAGRGDREHFGFTDGLSQPLIEGNGPFAHIVEKARPTASRLDVTKPGEFILGYSDELGKIAPPATVSTGGPHIDEPGAAEFGRNGSYLVFRHIAQHVGAFRTFLRESTRALNGEPDLEAAQRLAGKIVGRWPNGAPLVLADFDQRQLPSSTNAFLYGEDQEGLKCPIGAHIRRANPRDGLDPADQSSAVAHVRRRRLLRRGRSFGQRLTEEVLEDDHKSRGLYFICLCADLERQFEFVQQSWLNNSNFASLCGEVDPLIGLASEKRNFSVPGPTGSRRFSSLPDFVTLKGGAYFFLPSLHALRTLAAQI